MATQAIDAPAKLANVPLWRGSTEGEHLSIAGDAYGILLTGSQTGGQYAVWEMWIGPGHGPPPHTHTREDEAFYVFSGELVFMLDGTEHTARPGTLIHAPRHIEHTFRNATRTFTHALGWVAPAGLERFYYDIGEPLPRGTTIGVPVTEAHVAKIMEFAPKYGLKVGGPG